MRQLEPKRVTIGEVEYAIYPFGAFDAAAISGDLAKMLGPFMAGFLPFVNSDDNGFTADAKEVVPVLAQAFQSLDGDKLQWLLRQLLIVKKNINCEYREEDGQVVQKSLTADLANQLFVGRLDEMIQLALEVVRFNFDGFFTRLLNQYGDRTEPEPTKTRKSTGSSTRKGFVPLS